MEENDTFLEENDTFLEEDDDPEEKEEGGVYCMYCDKQLSKVQWKKHHEERCIENDEVRKMEIKLGIEYNKPQPNQCRFCLKVLARTSVLKNHISVCKQKKAYAVRLEKEVQREDRITHINNTTNNNCNNTTNNIQNNIHVHVQGSEDLSHITMEYLEDLLWKNQRTMQRDTQLQMVNDVYKKPENQNWMSTNHKIDAVHVKTRNGYEMQNGTDVIGEVSERIFRETGANGKQNKLRNGNFAVHYRQYTEKVRDPVEHKKVFDKVKATRHGTRTKMNNMIGTPE